VEAIHDFDSAIRLFERKIQKNQDATNKKKAVAGLRAMFTPITPAGTSTHGHANMVGTLTHTSSSAALLPPFTPQTHTMYSSSSMPVMQTPNAMQSHASASITQTNNLLMSLDENQAKVLKYTQTFAGYVFLCVFIQLMNTEFD
jgi:hypothetical protein